MYIPSRPPEDVVYCKLLRTPTTGVNYPYDMEEGSITWLSHEQYTRLKNGANVVLEGNRFGIPTASYMLEPAVFPPSWDYSRVIDYIYRYEASKLKIKRGEIEDMSKPMFRFKTRDEFIAEELWHHKLDTPKGWGNGSRNNYLGEVIHPSYNAMCISSKSFYIGGFTVPTNAYVRIEESTAPKEWSWEIGAVDMVKDPSMYEKMRDASEVHAVGMLESLVDKMQSKLSPKEIKNIVLDKTKSNGSKVKTDFTPMINIKLD